MDFHAHKPIANVPPQRVALLGQSLLASPRFNKGTAFTSQEREAFCLEGRLPYRIHTLEEQCARAWGQVQARTTDMAKNTFMQSLKEQNWVLYYALLSRHLRELVPIIYTPTEVRIYFPSIVTTAYLKHRCHSCTGGRDCGLLAYIQAQRGSLFDLTRPR